MAMLLVPTTNYAFFSVQSEDIRMLRHELELGIKNLEKIAQLRDECIALSYRKDEWNKKCTRSDIYIYIYLFVAESKSLFIKMIYLYCVEQFSIR